MFMFALSVTGVCAHTVKADEWNIEIKITINQLIEAAGHCVVGWVVCTYARRPARGPFHGLHLEGSRAPHYCDCIR